MKRILFALTLILACGAAFAYVPSEYAALCEIYEAGDWGVPDDLGGSSAHVTDLNLYNFTEVPTAIQRLPYLENLSLSYTGITNYPSFLGNLSHLKSLDISGNELTAIPSFVFSLTSLKYLDLQFNSLTSVPAGIGNLINLESLNLSWNNISSLPSLSGLYKLKNLYLARNAFTSFPTQVCGLGALEYLELSNNRGITSIPESITSLTNLEMLLCWQCGISSLPSNISQFQHLEGLYLGDNRLNSVPGSLAACVSLKYLNLDTNNLTTLPDLGSLYNLTELHLGSNNLTTFPKGVTRLENLTSLTLDYNYITSVPDEIKDMPALNFLGLYFNELTSFPQIDPEKIGTFYRLDLGCNHLPMAQLLHALTEDEAERQFPTQRLTPDPVNPVNAEIDQAVILKDVVVTMVDEENWCAYVNSPDNIWGIKVYGIAGHHGNASGKITVKGTMSVEENGECVVYSESYTTSDPNTKAGPKYMANKKLGGGKFGNQIGTTGSEGLNNVGLYVRTTGKVIETGYDDYGYGYEYIIIDDGTAGGIKVYKPSELPAIGKQVVVTGAVSIDYIGGKAVIIADNIKVIE